jgi:hypothetical protein
MEVHIMADTSLITPEMQRTVEDLTEILDMLCRENHDRPYGVRLHVADRIAILIDEATAGKLSPHAFHGRVVELRQEFDASARVH